MDALNCIEDVSNLERKFVDSENPSALSALSLFAIVEGPRLRLLRVTLQRLRTKAGIVSTSCSPVYLVF